MLYSYQLTFLEQSSKINTIAFSFSRWKWRLRQVMQLAQQLESGRGRPMLLHQSQALSLLTALSLLFPLQEKPAFPIVRSSSSCPVWASPGPGDLGVYSIPCVPLGPSTTCPQGCGLGDLKAQGLWEMTSTFGGSMKRLDICENRNKPVEWPMGWYDQ